MRGLMNTMPYTLMRLLCLLARLTTYPGDLPLVEHSWTIHGSSFAVIPHSSWLSVDLQDIGVIAFQGEAGGWMPFPASPSHHGARRRTERLRSHTQRDLPLLGSSDNGDDGHSLPCPLSPQGISCWSTLPCSTAAQALRRPGVSTVLSSLDPTTGQQLQGALSHCQQGLLSELFSQIFNALGDIIQVPDGLIRSSTLTTPSSTPSDTAGSGPESSSSISTPTETSTGTITTSQPTSTLPMSGESPFSSAQSTPSVGSDSSAVSGPGASYSLPYSPAAVSAATPGSLWPSLVYVVTNSSSTEIPPPIGSLHSAIEESGGSTSPSISFPLPNSSPSPSPTFLTPSLSLSEPTGEPSRGASPSPPTPHGPNIGAIIGVVLGTLIVLLGIVLALIFLLRRRARAKVKRRSSGGPWQRLEPHAYNGSSSRPESSLWTWFGSVPIDPDYEPKRELRQHTPDSQTTYAAHSTPTLQAASSPSQLLARSGTDSAVANATERGRWGLERAASGVSRMTASSGDVESVEAM